MSVLSSRILIVIATHNAGDTLSVCLASIMPQLDENSNVVVVDGGSTDNTLAIAKKFKVTYISEPDDGIYDAWNKAIKAWSFDWVTFIGADDLLLSGALNKWRSYLSSTPRANDIIFSRACYYKNNRRVIIGEEFDGYVFERYMNVVHPGALHSKSLFEGVSFDKNFKIAGDYEFLLRRHETLVAGYIDFVCVELGLDGVSQSNPYVFYEKYMAKRMHTRRSKIIISIELFVDLAKFFIRKVLNR